MAASVMMVVAGCGQDAGNTPSGSADLTTSPGRSGERATTAEQTASDNGLECPGGMGVGGFFDYAPGAKGEKANPVELARRDFSKQIDEGDTVEIADRPRGRNARTVRVVRDGRVVALIEYRRAGGGWLQDHYEACANF